MRQQPQPHAGKRDEQALARLAKRQHGVVSGRQLRERLGYSHSAIARAAAAGRLHRLHRDVYAVDHTSLSEEGSLLAGVLAGGPSALLSHRSAGWLWGILPGEFPIEVTAPTPRHGRGGIRLHRARALGDDDRVLRSGIPVTALPRTLLDLAAILRPDALDRVLERSEQLDLFDLPPVKSLLARTTRHPGAGRLRRAIAMYRDDPAFIRSRLEGRFLRLVRASSLPQPAMNVFAAGFELDVYWERERFAIELDSFGFHSTRRAFYGDRRREEDLKLAGIEMMRVTWRRLDEGEQELLEHIGILLEERRRGQARSLTLGP